MTVNIDASLVLQSETESESAPAALDDALDEAWFSLGKAKI